MRYLLLNLLGITFVFAQFPFFQMFPHLGQQSSTCGCQSTPPSTPITTGVAPGTPVRRRKVLRYWRTKRSTHENSQMNSTEPENMEHCSSRILKKTLEQVLLSNSFNVTSTVTDLTVSLFHQGVHHPGVVCGPAPIYFSMDSKDYCRKYDPKSKWECYLFMLD